MLSYDDLELALEFSSSGEMFGSSAYIDRETGKIYYVSDVVDEEYPEDIEESEKFVLIPHKRELDLGKSLAISFTEQYLPGEIGEVYKIFSSRGAYSAFKAVLEDHGLLQKWYQHEKDSTKTALIEWSKEAGLKVSI